MEAKIDIEPGGSREADTNPFVIMDVMRQVTRMLARRDSEDILGKVNVQSTSYCLLQAALITLNATKKGSLQRATLYGTCKNIITHLLHTLPEAGENYLTVFKLIHDICLGELSLSQSDLSLLSKHLELSGQREEEEDDANDDQKTTPTGSATPTPQGEEEEVRSKVDAKAEVSKLFKQFKSDKQETPRKRIPVPATPPKKTTGKHVWKKQLFKVPRSSQALTPELPGVLDSFVLVCRDVVDELGVGDQLIDFCSSLPIFKKLSNGAQVVVSPPPQGEGSEEGETSLNASLHEVRNAVEAISILLHTPYLLLPPFSASKLVSLADILVGCFQAAGQGTVATSSLQTKKKKEEATSGELDNESVSQDDFQIKPSISELYGSLSCCVVPAVNSPTIARALTSSIVSMTLKLYQKLFLLQLNTSIQRNIRTLFVYHIFTTLQPILSPQKMSSQSSEQGGGGETVGASTRSLGTVRLTTPLVELLIQAVDNLRILCEEMSVVTKDSEATPLTPQSFEVGGVYSSHLCVDMLISYLPLFKDLFSLVKAAYKKIHAHVTSSVGASQTEDPSHPLPKPHLSADKHLRFLMKLSLEKVTEKLSCANNVGVAPDLVGASGDDGEDEGDLYSPSPVSTISSSGEAGGVYTLYSDAANSEDERDLSDDDYNYELSPHFLMASLGLDYAHENTPSIPPPPPLPPRRPSAKDVKSKISAIGFSRIHFGSELKPNAVVDIKKKKPVLFLHLALMAVKCLNSGFVQNKDPTIQRFIREKLHTEHVSCLAWLVQNLDGLIIISNSSSNTDTNFSSELANLGSNLMEMVQEMIVSGIINRQYLHSVLLNELGLNAKCWPLQVTPAALSLLGRVLVCRFGEGYGNGGGDGGSKSEDDHLTVNIWKGFLHSLEESACSDEEPDEDLDVTHLQLMLFVWYTFSFETRAFLLTSCAHALIRASQAKQQGVQISPVINCRLLLLMDYLIFQFNDPPPDLTNQVNANLFQSTVIGRRTSSRSSTSNKTSSSGYHSHISCYPNGLQLNYSSVLTKPNTLSDQLENLTHPHKDLGKAGLSPRFYNVRKQFVSCGRDEEDEEEENEGEEDRDSEMKVETKINEEACRLLLTLPVPSDLSDQVGSEVRGYDLFTNALLSLMATGMEYTHQNLPLSERVLLACSAHQCFSVSLSILSNLPPSYRALSAVVGGKGLSLMNPEGACLLIHSLHLCMKFKMEHVDTEDIVDTLLMSGYSSDTAEEMVARMISVMNSPDHFEDLTVSTLQGMLDKDDDGMVPLVSIVALDLLLCLITRGALMANEEMAKEELMMDKTPKSESSEAFLMESKLSIQLGPLLINLVQKLLHYAHLYVTSSPNEGAGPYTTPCVDGPQEALDVLLSLSGKNLVSPKDRPLFTSHLPEGIHERLKMWESALPIDPIQKKRLSDYVDIQVAVCIVNFLDSHFLAFGGTRTFDPCRSLKSAINSALVIVDYIFSVSHNLSDEGSGDHMELISGIEKGVIPLSCDAMMEFAHPHLMKFVIDPKKFSFNCSKYKLTRCMEILQLSEMRKCELLGMIVADLFQLLNSLLKDSSEGEGSVFDFVFSDEQNTNVTDLLMLASLPSTSGDAMTESLQFLISLLTKAEKSSSSPTSSSSSSSSTSPQDLSKLLAQVSSLSSLSSQQLTAWLRRLVISSSLAGSAEVKSSASLLRKFVEMLTKSECKVDPSVGSCLLSALLSLGTELIHTLSPPYNLSLYHVFREYFDCLVLLAGTNKQDGHIHLVRAVMEWLPNCIQVTRTIEPVGTNEDGDKKAVKEAIDPDDQHMEESFTPLNSLFLYLSRLTTAIQFSCNVTEYTERRAHAGEDDLLFDEDVDGAGDEGEEAGPGISSGVGGADEDETTMDESDNEDLNSKLCTFTLTQREFANQHWYHCHTCHLVNGSGCCTVCAKVCHKGHDVTYSKLGSFFCDCGAKKNDSCKALVKRSGGPDENSGTSHPPPFSDPPIGRLSSRGARKRRKAKQHRSKKDQEQEDTTKKTTEKKHWVKRRFSFPTLPVLKLAQQIEGYKSQLQEYIETSGIADHSLTLLHQALPTVVRDVDLATSSGCSQARKAMIQLHSLDKKIEYTDNLMASTLGSQEGAFENVRLNFNDNQGATMRHLLTSNSITRVAMCALTSFMGKRQHLCVNHDKGKLTILQLFPILKQADSNRRKLTLTRLSTTSVPFTVLSMTHNPCNEDLLVVCGLTECQLLVINSSGQVTNRSLLHPSVGTGYIVKALWIPGSRYELVLISDSFVKIYDTHVDVICPAYYFVLDDGKIKDATVAVSDEGKFVVIMTSTGKIFSQPIVPSVTANDGPVYFTMSLDISHPSVVAGSEGVINGGGASVYYSQTLKMLFFSYFNGVTCIATTNPSLSKTTKIFDVVLKSNQLLLSGSKNPGQSLIYWMEVPHHPGLVCAISRTTANPVTLLIKPDTILIHEMKPLPNKAKVQGMVAMRQHPATGEVSPRRTTLIILCEDGSLRIYVANISSNTEFWLQPQFQPTSPLAVLRAPPLRRSQATTKKSEAVKFPIDFFEHCQLSNDIEFEGNDILHVYNKEQVLHRLNTAGLYIANAKPGGFSMSVTNLQSSTMAVMGIRVYLRSHSMEKSPSFIEVFGRTNTINFSSSASRWVDIPFAREETIQADKGFKITFGPSIDPSGVNIIDTIHVYVKSKEAIGWPEHPPPSTPSTKSSTGGGASAVAQTDAEQSTEVMPMLLDKDCSAVDSLVCNAMVTLSNHFISVKQEKKPHVMDLVTQGTTLLMYSVPFQLQYRYKFLLSSLADSRDLYHKDKDILQLTHVIHCLSKQQSRSSLMEPEYFQYLLLMLITIGKSRPQNLLHIGALLDKKLVEEISTDYEMKRDDVQSLSPDTQSLSAFIHLINGIFWKIFVTRSSNPAIAPVVNPGFAAVDLTVASLTEIMWSLVILDHALLGVVLKFSIKFLLAPDSHLCVSCSRVIMRLLKAKKEKVVIVDPCCKDKLEPADDDAGDVVIHDGGGEEEETGGGEEETGGGEERNEEAEVSGDGQEEEPADPIDDWQELVQPPVDPRLDIASVFQEHLIPNQEQLMAMQGMIHDEEAMMNFAIALSLGNEGGGSNSGGAQGSLQSYLQNLIGASGGGEGGKGGVIPPPPTRDSEMQVSQSHPLEPSDTPPSQALPQPEEMMIAERSNSSSPSSLFSIPPEEEDAHLLSQLEGVLREGTATPSERQAGGREPEGDNKGEREDKEGAGNTSEEKAPVNQNDMNSEPEIANDSSAEEESGLDEQTLVDNLSVRLEESSKSQSQSDNPRPREVYNHRLASLRKLLLLQLVEHLHLPEGVGGMRSICYLQLMIFLTSNLECCQEDSEVLVTLLHAFLKHLKLRKEDVLDDAAIDSMVERGEEKEVFLLYLRFFNILMSRRKVKGEESSSFYNSHMLWFLTTKTLLSESNLMSFSRRMLSAIMNHQSCLETPEDSSGTSGGGGGVLFAHPLDDLSPFFQKQYVKGHSADVFSSYNRLVAEILLVLPCQLKKTSEVTDKLSTPEFGPEWISTLCEFLLSVAQTVGVGRRHVRKLLLQICGSKENYRQTRDVHALRSYIKVIIDSCEGAGFDPKVTPAVPLNLGYKAMLTMIEQLKACGEVAATRTNNWQVYCQKEKRTLPYLFQALFVLDEGLAPTILQLVYSALSGTPPSKDNQNTSEQEAVSKPHTSRSARRRELEEQQRKSKEKSKEKEIKVSVVVPDKELCKALVQMFLSFVDSHSLACFSELFLLQANSSPLRWQAHKLLHCLYQYSSTEEQVSLVEMLWSLWPNMPNHGHKAAQFVDLLGYLTISTPQVLEKSSLCQLFVERAVSLLKKQNSLLYTHPNSHIYSQLRSLVDFDGFYLESEPCLVCNDPEIQSSMLKLQSVKSEIRYTPNMILVKLIGSHSISQITLRISEIKRTKMVRTVNVYYSNRTVQNVIELKNKRSSWLMAKCCSLATGQNEVKIDLPLPIIASNIIIQFSELYDTLQGGTEVLQCPRCQATVPAHPGVCGTCGENVYQCHKCRAINYDEKDPFLCNSCGFCKYAKFDIFFEGKSCSAVDPIKSEGDRKKTMSSINLLLEKADKIYRQQVSHRNDLDQLLVCLASGATFHVRNWSSVANDIGVNKGIQLVAQRYSIECKTIYTELSKIIQNVLASRKELVKYDTHKGENSEDIEGGGEDPLHPATTTSPHPSPKLSSSSPGLPLPSSQPIHHHGRCYGCASAATEHCITLLKALTFQTKTRRPLVQEKLIRELVEVNLRSGSGQMQRDIRKLLCQLTRDDASATAELNDLIYSRITSRLVTSHVDPSLTSLVRPEMLLLMASLDMEDSCWEQRLKTVVKLFRKSQMYTSPAVMAGVTMPCLKIMHTLIYPRDSKKDSPSDESLHDGQISVKVSDWLSGDSNYKSWMEKSTQKSSSDFSSMEKETLHRFRLMEKYGRIWRERTKKVSQFRSTLRQASWLRSMLFNPSSQSARKSTCNMISSLSQGEVRQRQILDLLCGFLDDVSSAGEHAQEFLELLKNLIDDPSGKWKSYLAMRGVLPRIGALITQEIAYLQHLEETTLSSDLSQGYALKMLTGLLQSFLSIDSIKQLFKRKLIGTILNGYLSLKRLVVQRTKRVDESQGLLLEMLEDLTSGTDEERRGFMVSCIETLNMFKQVDLITPVFLFERLSNIIRPEDNDVGEFYLFLDKDPQQEEFLQGRMQGNPYPSSSSGLGPLMRDVKNKICTDCELVALLEDDTGMELLVCNKIISLDLPVKEVYKKIWCAQQNHNDTMRVIYRMRGLLGDATEEMVEQLDDGKDKDSNEEEEYKMSAVLSKCGGLDAILSRLSHVKDFIQGHPLISAALKLLGHCVRLKENRQFLLLPHLNTLNILLGTLDQALHYEERSGNGIGASVAESVLIVTERILQEASTQRGVLVRTTSQESCVSSGGAPLDVEGDDQLQVFLKHIESLFVQANPALREGLMHIIPFLTFGVTKHMNVLLQHFAPYLNFEKFDSERSPENRLYLDCFCVVASGIGKDGSGEKLKDLAIEMNITPSAVTYLKETVPQKPYSDTVEWKSCILQPSLPYVLKMLTGLCHWHTKTQEALLSVVGELHLLEQIASDQHIGTLAENLLEAMMENKMCEEEIKSVRRATRQRKKELAMAMRAKELGSLGMQVNEKGQVIASKSSLVSDIETELVEEAGLKCCICLEGYRNQPNKILGIYTFTRKVTLDEFENKPKKTKGYATVSHFNVVHYECHSSAVTLARSRDEWQSATLQNANTKCNGLLPIWGSEITESNFSGSMARHINFMHECTGLYDHSYHIMVHDLRLLLLRFAYEKSFSAESGGGGPQSNLYLVPYLMHIALYVVNTKYRTDSYQKEEKNMKAFLSSSPDKIVALSYELDGPQYTLIQSLFLHSLAQWKEHRLFFLKSLLILAHIRNISSTPIKRFPSAEPADFAVYRPHLILIGLVDALQKILKPDSVDEGDIPSALLDFIRNNDVTLMEGCDKVLSLYQDKLLKIDSFGSFCDTVGEGFGEIPNRDTFISQVISSIFLK